VAHNLEVIRKNKFLAYPTMILIGTNSVVLNVWYGMLNDQMREAVLGTINQKIRNGQST
jgi:hypothetical protein